MVLGVAVSGLHAAGEWQMYTGDVLPGETEGYIGPNLDISSQSEWRPSAQHVSEILADSSGNMHLKFLFPTENVEISDGDMEAGFYRHYFADSWTDSVFTIVLRTRKVVTQPEDTIDDALEFQIRNGNANVEEVLIIKEDGVEFENAGLEEDIAEGFSEEFHTYRIAVDGNRFDLYIDEADTAFMTSNTSGDDVDETGDRYFKFGNGNTGNGGAVVDYVMIDTTGAYTPQENPIPNRQKSVVVATSREKMAWEQPLMDNLMNRGYAAHTFIAGENPLVEVDTLDYLNSFDLVIVGRGSSSGTFGDENRSEWNSISTPLLCMSSWATRSHRMNWFNHQNALHSATDLGIDLGLNDQIKARVEKPEKINVEFNGNYVFYYWMGPFDIAGTEDPGNGEVLMTDGLTGYPALVRFEPWEEFYPGSADKPAGYRSYIPGGNDNEPTMAMGRQNYYAYTDMGWEVVNAEIDRMVRLPQEPSQPEEDRGIIAYWGFTGAKVDTTGTHADQQYASILEDAGYTVWKMYDPALSFVSDAVIDSLWRADLVVIGRTGSSSHFGPPNKSKWHTITTPILNVNPWTVRAQRLNWMNTETTLHVDTTAESDAPGFLDEWMREQPNVVDSLTLTAPAFNSYTFTGLKDMFVIPWIEGAYDIPDAQESEVGGTVYGKVDSNVAYVRWDPNTEFYEGAGESAAGYRTYMGYGHDNYTSATGAQIFLYDNFTPEARGVFLREVERLVALGKAQKVGVEEEKSGTPETYQLADNYPNPFNPTTTIEYQLAKSQNVELTVYNLLGEKVTTLVDEQMPAGSHSVQFNASNLPAGVYLYRITAGDFTESKKMVLIK